MVRPQEKHYPVSAQSFNSRTKSLSSSLNLEASLLCFRLIYGLGFTVRGIYGLGFRVFASQHLPLSQHWLRESGLYGLVDVLENPVQRQGVCWNATVCGVQLFNIHFRGNKGVGAFIVR